MYKVIAVWIMSTIIFVIGAFSQETLRQKSRNSGAHKGKAVKAERRANPAKMMQKLDQNGDGQIALEEFKGNPKAFKRMDFNQNGFLDLWEVEFRSLRGPEQTKSFVKKMDADKNGGLCAAELPLPATLYARIDSDKNKLLTAAELGKRGQGRGKGNPQRMAQALKKMDTNSDGRVSRSEYKGPQKRFERIDANKDGFLDKVEVDKFLKSTALRGQKGKGKGRGQDRFKRMDTNKDGKITREEFKGKDEAFTRMDRNSDDVIDQSDRSGKEKKRKSRKQK
jgi:Ca2+-binding EF-hand superfamily protein